MSIKTVDTAGCFRTMPDALETASGRIIQPLLPAPGVIWGCDIAHALALICRYGGHCVWHYSVAQHSCYVHDLVRPELRLAALLHDAAEAYLGDVPRPLKRTPAFADYRRAEARLMQAIWDRFGVSQEHCDHPDIKGADNAICRAEMRVLMPSRGEGKDWRSVIAAATVIERWQPDRAMGEFLARWRRSPKWDFMRIPTQERKEKQE